MNKYVKIGIIVVPLIALVVLFLWFRDMLLYPGTIPIVLHCPGLQKTYMDEHPNPKGEMTELLDEDGVLYVKAEDYTLIYGMFDFTGDVEKYRLDAIVITGKEYGGKEYGVYKNQMLPRSFGVQVGDTREKLEGRYGRKAEKDIFKFIDFNRTWDVTTYLLKDDKVEAIAFSPLEFSWLLETPEAFEEICLWSEP